MEKKIFSCNFVRLIIKIYANNILLLGYEVSLLLKPRELRWTEVAIEENKEIVIARRKEYFKDKLDRNNNGANRRCYSK